jgi:hypothetical protein
MNDRNRIIILTVAAAAAAAVAATVLLFENDQEVVTAATKLAAHARDLCSTMSSKDSESRPKTKQLPPRQPGPIPKIITVHKKVQKTKALRHSYQLRSKVSSVTRKEGGDEGKTKSKESDRHGSS